MILRLRKQQVRKEKELVFITARWKQNFSVIEAHWPDEISTQGSLQTHTITPFTLLEI